MFARGHGTGDFGPWTRGADLGMTDQVFGARRRARMAARARITLADADASNRTDVVETGMGL